MKITGKDKHMKRILIVEDELYLQKTIKELLEKHGYHTITSSSLSDAMHYVLNIDDIDLFLLDIWLPDGDGFQLCRHIRQRSIMSRKNPTVKRKRNPAVLAVMRDVAVQAQRYSVLQIINPIQKTIGQPPDIPRKRTGLPMPTETG